MLPPSVKHITQTLLLLKVITVQKYVKYFTYFVHHVTLFSYNISVFTIFVNVTAGIT